MNSALIFSPIALFFFVWGPRDFDDPVVWVLFLFPTVYVVSMNIKIRESRYNYFLGHIHNPTKYYAAHWEELWIEDAVENLRKIMKGYADTIRPSTLYASLDTISLMVEVLSTEEEKMKIREIERIVGEATGSES